MIISLLTMPRKTKKQKVLAKLHRKLASLEVSPNITKSQNKKKPSTNTKPILENTKFVYKRQPVIKQKSVAATTNYAFIKYDLIKISLFTTLALALQGVLYFLLNK